MANKEFRTVTADGRIVYNLDSVTNIATKTLVNTNQLALQSASSSLMNVLPNMSALLKTLEPVRQVIEIIQESCRKIWEQIREGLERLMRPFSILFSTRPIYFVPTEPVVSQERHLAITNDTYGFFLIDGKQLTVLHPASSRCGKLLAVLLKRRATVVDYQTLKQEIGAGDLDKDFKDLKYQLRKNGYKLDYQRPRTQGIALIGIKELQ